MASFASQPNIPFAPYVSQVDPQTYATVGLFKQQQYDTNIQKIQGYYDSIAGIDVVKDEHKAYLDNAVKGIQTESQKLAGADFSNQQLVNKALSLASRVAKDPIIQNAYKSTQTIKSGYQAMEQARKDGKWSPANEWYFQNEVDKWKSDGKLDTSFSANYVPYRDVRAKMAKGLESIDKDIQITENGIQINADGSVSLSPYAPALLRKKIEGISPERLKEAMYAYLDAGDIQQLQIEGRYTYRGATPESLKESIDKNFNAQVGEINAQIKKLNDKKSTLTAGDEINRLDETIKLLESQKSSYTDNYNNYISYLQKGNVGAVIDSIYPNEAISNFANSFVKPSEESTIESNPYFEAELEKQKFRFQIEKWNEEKQLEMISSSIKGLPAGGMGQGGLPQGLSGNNVPSVTLSTVKDGIVAKTEEASAKKAQLLNLYGQDEEWYNQQVQLINEGKPVDGVVKTWISDIESTEADAMSAAKSIEVIEEEARMLHPLAYKDLPKDAKPVTFNYKGAQYNFTPEELATYSYKRAMYDKGPGGLAALWEPFAQLGAYAERGLTGKDVKTSFEVDFYNKEFTDKEKVLFQLDTDLQDANWRSSFAGGAIEMLRGVSDVNLLKRGYNAITGSDLPTGREVNRVDEANLQVGNELMKYKKNLINMDNAGYDEIKARDEYINKNIADRLNVPVPKTFPVSVDNKSKEYIKGRVGELLLRGSQQDNSFGEGADYDVVKKLNSKDDTQYFLYIQPGGEYNQPSYYIGLEGDKEDVQMIKISAEEKFAIFQNKYEPDYNQFNTVENRISLTGNGTTNFSGISDLNKALVNPFYTKKSFPSVTNFSVSGDLAEFKGQYGLYLYIYDPKEQKYQRRSYTPKSGLLDATSVNAVIQNITDDAIYKMLYGNDPSEEDMTEIINLNKRVN